ncbi:MAG TPA: carboxypeptidase-like regulatory domain-containing protein [Chitinivibrionales bacterium]|nr:carboxypeptidase-like regulatory domain-containing protein [Chitinivibrionales bacterium]
MRNKKFMGMIWLATGIIGAASGQNVIQSDLSGTVTDANGNPRSGAIVMLVNAGLIDSTDDNGNFTLQGDVGVRHPASSVIAKNEAAIRGNKLFFTIHSVRTPVAVELFDCLGRMLYNIPPADFSPGSHFISIVPPASPAMAVSAIARVFIGHDAMIFRFPGLGSAPAQGAQVPGRPAQLSKTLAVVDTLLVSDFNSMTVRVPLTQYVASALNVTVPDDNRTNELILNDVIVIGGAGNTVTRSTDEIYRAPGGDSGTTLSFFGTRTTEAPDFVDVDYVQFTNPNGQWPYRIVYSRELLPINWSIDSFTIVVTANGEDSINPYQVVHLLYGADTVTDTFTLCLYPGDLHVLLGKCKTAVPAFDTMPVHAFFASNGINQYNDLLRLAYTRSANTAYYRYLCVVFSTAQACIEMTRVFPSHFAKVKRSLAAAKRSGEFGPTTIAEDLLKTMLKSVLKEIARDLLAKPPSGIGALLCEGADDNWDECKYQYVPFQGTATGSVPPDAITKCMSICSWVTLACFTNICMPMTLEEAEAGDIKQQLANFDQQYFGGIFTSSGLLKTAKVKRLR